MLSGDFAELERFANGLGAVGVAVRPAFDAAARSIGESARAGYRAGVGPMGETWEPKKDGTLAMQGPAADVTFAMSGNDLVGEAPDVFEHHTETRPVFPPDGSFPDAWSSIVDDALESGLGKVFAK